MGQENTMSAKKNTSKKTTKSTKAAERRPAKRKVITTLAQYETEVAAAAQAAEPAADVAATVEPVQTGNLAEGIQVPAPAKRKRCGITEDNKGAAVDAAMQAVAADKKKRSSGLDAAAQVLAEAGEPLSTGEMVKRMLEKGLWTTDGRTPAATIYSAILREINVKGDRSRFRKTERGRFELTK